MDYIKYKESAVCSQYGNCYINTRSHHFVIARWHCVHISYVFVFQVEPVHNASEGPQFARHPEQIGLRLVQ